MKVPVGRHSSSTHHDSRLTTTRQLEVLAPSLLAAVICGGTTGGCDAICCMICWKFSCKPIAKGDCSTCVWNWDRFMREVIYAEECWRSKRLASKFYQLYQEVLTVLAFNVAFSNGPRSSTGSSNKSSTGQLERIVSWCILYIKVCYQATAKSPSVHHSSPKQEQGRSEQNPEARQPVLLHFIQPSAPSVDAWVICWCCSLRINLGFTNALCLDKHS